MSSIGAQEHRYLIIGAGPAGLQLSYYLQQAGLDYLTLERERTPGCFFSSFPRHRKLISLNKVHSRTDDLEIKLRWDWNSLLSHSPELMFSNYSTDYFPHADDMVRYLKNFQRSHELAVRFGVEVERIQRVGEKILRAGHRWPDLPLRLLDSGDRLGSTQHSEYPGHRIERRLRKYADRPGTVP